MEAYAGIKGIEVCFFYFILHILLLRYT
jgi:hypothetical protein